MPGLRGGITVNKADLKNLNSKLKALEGSPVVLNKITKHEAQQAVGRMRRDAPVDTGRLRRDIEIVKQTKDDIIIESSAVDPVTKVDYAPIQEYGLHGLKPQPYFRKNIREMFSRLTNRLNLAIKKIVNK